MTRLHLRVRQHGSLARIRGIEIDAIERAVTVSHVPGSQFGMALVRGQIVPVIRLGEASECLVVGRVRGEVVGIAGLEVIGFEPGESSPIAGHDCGVPHFDRDPNQSTVPPGDTPIDNAPVEPSPGRAPSLSDSPSGDGDRSKCDVDIDVAAIFDRFTRQPQHPSQALENQP